jgi:nitroreductase
VKDPLGFGTAPVFIVVLGDTRVRDFGPPHLRSDDNTWRAALVSSLAAAYEHMHLAAASMGLATRWVSAVSLPPIEPKIKEFLGVPEQMLVYEMMALGYSDFQPHPKKMRLLSEVIHFGACSEGEFRSDAEIAEYFSGGR